MPGTTLVFAECENGELRESVWESLGLAHRRGGDVVTVVLAADASGPATALKARGGGRIYAASHPAVGQYTADGFSLVLEEVAAKEPEADLWLFPHTPLGWDLAPRLAARLGAPCGTEVFRVDTEGEEPTFVKKAFKAKFDMTFRLDGTPRIVTLQAGSQEPYVGDAEGTIVELSPALEDAAVRDRFVEVRDSEASEGAVDLTQSQVIVAGGRGLGGPEKFEIIEELAKALGGDVGASRPVTDAGWLPANRQIGSSGVRVKPKLYVAAGISGAIQHLVGMKDSGYIVAINKDPKAPIFEVCDVGVVGDLFEVVPALIQAIQEAKGGS